MRKFNCWYDFDTKLYQASLLLSNKKIIAKHIASGREKIYDSVTDFHGGRNKKEILGDLRKINEEKSTNFKKDDFEIIEFFERNLTDFDDARLMLSTSIKEIRKKSWCGSLKICIGGEGNFRKEIYQKYKCSRSSKPCEFGRLKEWLIKCYKSDIVICNGYESDDELSIQAYKCKEKRQTKDTWDTCLVHRDKDLLGVEGFYYNFYTKPEYPIWVSEEHAQINLFKQVLLGDRTDDIPGLEAVTKDDWYKYELKGRKYCVGKGNAKKLLSDCKTREDMIIRIETLYRNYYRDCWKEKLNISYKLVKLLEKPNEIKDFPFKG